MTVNEHKDEFNAICNRNRELKLQRDQMLEASFNASSQIRKQKELVERVRKEIEINSSQGDQQAENRTKTMDQMEQTIAEHKHVTEKRKEEHLDIRWRQKKSITELQEKLDIADETISLFQQSVSRLEQFDKKRQNRLEGRI